MIKPLPLLTSLCLVLALPAQAASPHAAHARAPARKPAPTRPALGPAYGQRADAMALADRLATQHQLPAAWVRQQIAHAHLVPGIPQLVLPPPVQQPKNWAAYRARFIEPRRIQAGVKFWQQHRQALERAQNQYGVPAALIVGILGVETLYGQHMGAHRVLDALTTLSLDFPQAHPRASERQAFFQDELGHFLVQLRRSPDKKPILGSYAGAMGVPQFMPSSWARFAVDFDGDGRIDLIHSPVDAIGSVGNYFKAFGWKTGQPTHFAVTPPPPGPERDDLLAPDILPSFSAATLQAKGAVLDAEGQQHSGPLALVELQNGSDPPSYVVGTENFYVVTRYNWSSYYAMAVIELGQAVQAAVPDAGR